MIREDLPRTQIPNSPGVYLFKTAGDRILYIGKAKSLKKRLQHYFTPSTLRKQDMVTKAHHVEFLPVTNEQSAILLENNLIRTHRPIYNNLIKGETSYVYIKIPHEPYPNILLTRYKKNDKATYIGPKVRKRELKQTLQLIRHLLKYRSCTPKVFSQGHVCSDYFFDLCAGRCAYHQQATAAINQQVGFHPIWTPEQAADQYNTIIHSIISYFKGHTKPLETTIKAHIDQAVIDLNFERAAKLRDIYNSLQALTEQQSIALNTTKSGIYVMITTHGKRLLRGVIQLVEGKIHDVLTGREHSDDTDLDSLFATISREYELPLTRDPSDSENFYSASSTDSKAFTAKEKGLLRNHLERFLEGYIDADHLRTQELSLTLLEELQNTYHLTHLPERIECTDISHFSGGWTSGAITHMYMGKLSKSGYRHYKITAAAKHDDYGALTELLIRRSRAKEPRPNLFIIDGGVGQLGIVKTLLMQDMDFAEKSQHVTFASLEKGAARGRKGKQAGHQEILHILQTDLSLASYPITYTSANQLLILLRDEAHRFANQYRKKRMSRNHGKE